MRITPQAPLDELALHREFVRYCMNLLPRNLSDDEISIIVRQLFTGEVYLRFLDQRRNADTRRN